MTILFVQLIVLLLAGYTLFSLLFYFISIRPRLRKDSSSSFKQETMLPKGPSPAIQTAPPDTSVLSKEATLLTSTGAQLKQELGDWQRTFDAIVDPVIILDMEMTVLKSNQAAVSLLSVDGQSIEGNKCHQLFAGSEKVCSICPVQTAIHEQSSYGQEIHHRYLGRTFFVSCAPIKVQDEIAGFVYTVKDISHQRSLEKQLVQAQKMEAIATLAGGIAHDFNNILGAILGNADLLLYRLPQKGEKTVSAAPPITFEEIAEHLMAVKRAGNRAKELVSQILAFSRQSTSKRKPVNIGPIIKEACKLLRSSLPATIEVKVSVAQNIGMIYGDPTQVQQVLMNLGSNAAQAIEHRSGKIEISLREIEAGKAEIARYSDLAPGEYIVLTVKDNGKGIPKEVLERIFDPFFTTREVGEGVGMGLAVIHGIIISHDGVIDVQSETGKGSVFTIFFPKVHEETDGLEDIIPSMPRGTETILFVDDEEDIVTMRTRMLEYLGYKVLPATNPEQALGYFTRESEGIDLVITDHTMPRMTGVQLAAEINKIRQGLPIILCSGYSEAVTTEEARKVGIRRFLAKPLDMRLLAMAIRELLSNSNVES